MTSVLRKDDVSRTKQISSNIYNFSEWNWISLNRFAHRQGNPGGRSKTETGQIAHIDLLVVVGLPTGGLPSLTGIVVGPPAGDPAHQPVEQEEEVEVEAHRKIATSPLQATGGDVVLPLGDARDLVADLQTLGDALDLVADLPTNIPPAIGDALALEADLQSHLPALVSARDLVAGHQRRGRERQPQQPPQRWRLPRDPEAALLP